MSEKVRFTVQLEDSTTVNVDFAKGDLSLVAYLVKKSFIDKGEKALLSLLMYPAIWSVENAIWQKEYEGRCESDAEYGNVRERFEIIKAIRSECFERARSLVKDELHRQAQEIESFCDVNATIGVHEFVLVNELGDVVFRAAFSKDDWAKLIMVLKRGGLSRANSFLINLMTLDLTTRLGSLLMERDFGSLWAQYTSSLNDDEIPELFFKEFDCHTNCMEIAKRRLFHCMD